jgi:hypothetical protein
VNKEEMLEEVFKRAKAYELRGGHCAPCTPPVTSPAAYSPGIGLSVMTSSACALVLMFKPPMQ